MTGRNDPCWCGSGKKYKKCHLDEDLKNGTSKEQLTTRPNNNPVKTPEEIDGMRKAGQFNGELMDYIRPFVKEGMSTEAINNLVHRYTVDNGHIPATLGYQKFPKSCCISINDVVCHGIPSSHRVIRNGDIVNVDLTSIVNGFHGDSSETFLIGDVSPEARKLVSVSAQALVEGINVVRGGVHLSAIGDTIEAFVERFGFSVVRQYTGHGIGRKFHEHFSVLHHHSKECEDVTLLPGMTFTIEPMINAGNYRVVTDRHDGWTVRTKDGSLSSQFEHTILVTESGCEILTQTPSQIAANIPVAFSPIQS